MGMYGWLISLVLSCSKIQVLFCTIVVEHFPDGYYLAAQHLISFLFWSPIFLRLYSTVV